MSRLALQIRDPDPDDVRASVALAAIVVGERRAAALLRAHAERRELLVADAHGEIAGVLAYRTDWFQCTFVSVVAVADRVRQRGVARALFDAVAQRSPSPRLFSSTEETNTVAIRMHRALDFIAAGYVDHLPQGYRELLFYKRLHL
jgi:ribosomal protein S18 acetylase RimI-like enzyme